ncbi:DUF7716 domain-containing protein [Anaerosporobacter sp.]|uniref:DUF7716 domain-containing protein n=1 Tax=Anaerosporobacter sp. TaxID=1872529 RepID=UPI00286F61A8|nr:hypothetical protein [Anaerosporobacter sp.]
MYYIEKHKPFTLDQILDYARVSSSEQNSEFESLYVYVRMKTIENDDISLNEECFFDDAPAGGDDDQDVFPLFVQENNLEVLCSCVQIVDVVTAALQQKPNVSTIELLESLDYYLRRDGFLELNKKRESQIHFVIMPRLTSEKFYSLIEGFGEKRLHTYQLISFKQGLVFYTYDKKSDYPSLAGYIDRQNGSALAISICENFWSHLLYFNGFCSPARCIMPGQEKKKKPKMEHAANLAEFQKAFPNTDVIIMEQYLFQEKYRGLERNAQTIKEFYHFNGMSEKLFQREGECYVMEEDRFPVGNSRQAFDFMRYLGYDLSVSLFC